MSARVCECVGVLSALCSLQGLSVSGPETERLPRGDGSAESSRWTREPQALQHRRRLAVLTVLLTQVGSPTPTDHPISPTPTDHPISLPNSGSRTCLEKPSLLPAAAGPCPVPQILTPPHPLAAPRPSFRHRCPTGATETRMAPLIGAASRDLPPECQVGTALSPGRPGLCSVTPTAGSFSVLRSLQVTPNPMAVSRLLRAWNPGAATPPKSRRGAGPRSRGTSRPGWRWCGWSGSWLGGLPQLHTCGSLHRGPPAPAARWTGGGLHKVGRGPEPAQRSSPPSPCHCPISLG